MPTTAMRMTSRGARLKRPRDGWAARLVILCVLAAVLSACGSSGGAAISVNLLPEEPPVGRDYIIGVGDLLNIQVYDQEKHSGSQRVRTDGKISLSLLNELEAAGKTPASVAKEIETSLKDLVQIPRVTVTVVESSPLLISVLGEVTKPGMQTLMRDVGVAEALAAAGGLTNFAHRDRIYVNRPGQPERIQFAYRELLLPTGRAQAFRLRRGDVVVVE